MRALIVSAMFAASLLPASAQRVADPPPPYDLENITLPQLVSIWETRQAWCGEQFKARKLKTATRAAHCIYDGLYDAMAKQNNAVLDLFQTMIAKQYAIADRYDHKKITWLQAEAETSEALSRLATDIQVRATALQQQAAEQERTRITQSQAAQAQVDAQALAQAESRRLQLCEAAGWGMPTRTGGFAEGMANAARARANCELGLPPPQPATTQTRCHRELWEVVCDTQ